MKKIVLISLSIFTVATIAFAQTAATSPKAASPAPQRTPMTPKSSEEKAKAGVASLNRIATLTPEQSQKVNKIYLDFYKQVDAFKEKKTTMSQQEYTAANLELVKKRNADIKALLTPEQMKLVEANHDARAKAKTEEKGPAEEKK